MLISNKLHSFRNFDAANIKKKAIESAFYCVLLLAQNKVYS